MCSDYSRPPSTPTGRLKPEYNTYNTSNFPQDRQTFGPQYENKSTEEESSQRIARPQSGSSPPQQEGAYYPVHLQHPHGYYYQQDTFPPVREEANVSAPDHQHNSSAGTDPQNTSPSGLPVMGGLPAGVPASNDGNIHARGHKPRAQHLRGKSFTENDIRATRHEHRQSTETLSVYHGPFPRRDSSQWMPAGPGTVPGNNSMTGPAPAIPYAGGGIPGVSSYYPAPSPYLGMPSQVPASQSWPMGYSTAQRPPEPYYPVPQHPQQWPQSEEGEGVTDPRYGPYYRAAPQDQRARNVYRPPQLVRTSALAQARSSWSFHGYSNYDGANVSQPREQAKLAIDGDLMDMTKNWDVDEQVNSRRLVLFERIQDGSQIRLKFRSIHRDDYDQQTTVISCIYWKEFKEYYVTSVDCITLLELIINQKFSVEEKNRVRRNLEVCKPKTISKSKKDLSSFFKLIMKFEPPRPRNIEKDVKVFPWSMLDNALQKIVSKYSASYFSNEIL